MARYLEFIDCRGKLQRFDLDDDESDLADDEFDEPGPGSEHNIVQAVPKTTEQDESDSK